MNKKLGWKVNTHGIFKEILDQDGMWMLSKPINIILDLLRQTAQRATELNDPQLNKLMIRLSLYDISNPKDPKFNPDLVRQILNE